jgi:hypothetical protein
MPEIPAIWAAPLNFKCRPERYLERRLDRGFAQRLRGINLHIEAETAAARLALRVLDHDEKYTPTIVEGSNINGLETIGAMPI